MAIEVKQAKLPRKSASISMAPMIDMVFLLLVFFMTASAMSQAGSKLELDLPESQGSEVAQDFSDRLILSLDVEGSAFLGTRLLDEAALREELLRFREAQPGAKLSIRAAKDTPFSAIKSIMKLAAEAGIDSYLYATYQVGES